MSKLSNIIEERFIKEIATEGLNWRIARMGTIMDLIVYSFVSYKNSNDHKHLEDIMLWILKGKIIYRLGELSTLHQTNAELLDYLNLQQPRVTNTFYLLLQEFEHLSYGTNYNLNEKIEYLRTLSHLEISNIHEDILNDTLIATLNYYEITE